MIYFRFSVNWIVIAILINLGVSSTVLAQQQPTFPGQRGTPGVQQRPVIPGQQQAPAVAMQRRETSRFFFAVYDQYSYRSHPFFQLTGVAEFEEARAASGGTANLGNNESDGDSNFLMQALHMLPPFGYEYSFPITELEYPRNISIGIDYSKVQQTDMDAYKKLPAASSPFLPRFEMDSYYLAVPIRFFLLPNENPGVNVFLGYSWGWLHGNLLSRGTGASGADQISSFNKSPVTAVRWGVDIKGDVFGGRFELMRMIAKEVPFKQNPFPGQTDVTTVKFSGLILRVAAYWKIE